MKIGPIESAFIWGLIGYACNLKADSSKSIKWQRAAYSIYWMVALSLAYFFLRENFGYTARVVREYFTIFLLVVTAFTAYMKKDSELMSVGFWICLLFLTLSMLAVVL